MMQWWIPFPSHYADGGCGYLRYAAIDGQQILGAYGSSHCQRPVGGYNPDAFGAANHVCCSL